MWLSIDTVMPDACDPKNLQAKDILLVQLDDQYNEEGQPNDTNIALATYNGHHFRPYNSFICSVPYTNKTMNRYRIIAFNEQIKAWKRAIE